MRRLITIIAAFSIMLGAFCFYAFLPRRSVTAMADMQTFQTLVLDPGHGGEDGGAVSAAGRKESEINLSVAVRTHDLAVLLGIPCVMTREDDRSLHTVSGSVAQRKASDLQYRVRFVNETPHPLLVSIHQNHFPQGKYHGAQVFYAQTVGSESLARQMQQLMRSLLDTTNHRAIKPCNGVFLMERVNCPAVLVECGFLSNADEEEKLHCSDYQKRIAAAILAAVSKYKSEANGIDQV